MRLPVDSSTGVTVIILIFRLTEPKISENLLHCVTENVFLTKAASTKLVALRTGNSEVTVRLSRNIADSVVVPQQPSLHVILDVGGGVVA
jgi:hypothetical protein